MGYGNLLLLLIYPDQWGEREGGGEYVQQNVNKNMFVRRGIYLLTPEENLANGYVCIILIRNGSR